MLSSGGCLMATRHKTQTHTRNAAEMAGNAFFQGNLAMSKQQMSLKQPAATEAAATEAAATDAADFVAADRRNYLKDVPNGALSVLSACVWYT